VPPLAQQGGTANDLQCRGNLPCFDVLQNRTIARKIHRRAPWRRPETSVAPITDRFDVVFDVVANGRRRSNIDERLTKTNSMLAIRTSVSHYPPRRGERRGPGKHDRTRRFQIRRNQTAGDLLSRPPVGRGRRAVDFLCSAAIRFQHVHCAFSRVGANFKRSRVVQAAGSRRWCQ